LDIQDVVTFKGETVAEAKQAFEESINDYLAFCESLGQEPNRPFSGKLPFR
jgi:predicted HicB family RNase H-like nuclease